MKNINLRITMLKSIKVNILHCECTMYLPYTKYESLLKKNMESDDLKDEINKMVDYINYKGNSEDYLKKHYFRRNAILTSLLDMFGDDEILSLFINTIEEIERE